MKKVLSVFLAMLMIFTCFSTVVAFAEDEITYTITFIDDDGYVLGTVVAGKDEHYTAVEYPVKEDTEKTRYIFKGWMEYSEDGSATDLTLYHQNTMPVATKDVTYIAVYSEKQITADDEITFFGLIRNIFARINAIFEYFYRIFSRDGIK